MNWQGGEMAFTASSRLAVLTLAYQRPPGQPRAEGWVELRNIEIVEAR
jgi:hypothetical protein